jgi:hypothetical protein
MSDLSLMLILWLWLAEHNTHPELRSREGEATLENVVPSNFVLLVYEIFQLRKDSIRWDGEHTVEGIMIWRQPCF